jgi:hypothetical protein
MWSASHLTVRQEPTGARALMLRTPETSDDRYDERLGAPLATA